MTGELIFDGLQDRAIAEDSGDASRASSADVEVRCVEQGREAGHLEFRAERPPRRAAAAPGR